MKIAILHQDLELTESDMLMMLKERGHEANLFDVRNSKIDDFSEYDLILNRVYASVANRDYKDNIHTLNLIHELEKQGKNCINSFKTSQADYSKYYSYLAMKKAGIPTPETEYLGDHQDIAKAIGFAKRHNHNVIIKRNIGGRAKGLKRCSSEEEVTEYLLEIFNDINIKDYNGGWVIQSFITSQKSHDARICVINGKMTYAFGRSLLSENDESPWLASISQGSQLIKYEPSQEEIQMAINATKAIGALFNEVDMYFTNEGPIIIENNCTPAFNPQREDRMEKISEIIQTILENEEKNIVNT